MRTVRTSRICIARISLGLVMVPILLSMLCLSDLASPRADAISYLLQIVIFQFFVMVVVHAGSSVRWRAYARVVLILSLALLSVKLSNVAFALGCCLVAVGIDVINHPPAVLRRWFPTLIFCLVFFAVFILRGYVQSGFPLYPSHVLPINFDWSKTVLEAKEHSLVIKEWARMPRQPLHSVIGKKDWFGDWLGRTMADKTFVVPFMAGILSWAIFALVKCRIGYFVHESLGSFTAWRFVCLLFPVCFGLGFWFYTVPEPRFAGGLLWMIAFIPVLIFMLADKSMRVIKFLRRNLVLAAFVMLTILCFSSIISAIHVKDGYATFPSPALKQITNPHGVRLYLPVEGVQIWDAPLPAAHHMSPDLQMRGESLQQGFRTNRSS
jgi:hypothetical protein